ncbi:MAG: efflux RND transporter periplasmic adaptor subunit [Bacteroidales bacterium]|nr:efflux RND transporter periplasmic adaptor subunit [Bacteroidales bacterium]
MKTRMVLYAGVLLFAGSLTAACNRGKQPAQGPKEYPAIVAVAEEAVGTATYSASIRGRQDIDVYPQISGTLTKLAVQEGERVKENQLLFVIDQVPYIAALRTAEANVKAAEAALNTAKLTYDSKKTLREKNVVSDFDLQTAMNNKRTAEATLEQMKALEVTARQNLSYTEIRSASEGVVGTLPYRKGALVSPNMPNPLTTVSDNSQMYVYFSLSENRLLSLTREYGSIEAAIANMEDVYLQLNDGSIYPQTGRIESISGVINRSTGTVSVRAVFPNPKGILLSGASGNVIMTERQSNAIIIPKAATFEVQDRVFVYKVKDSIATAQEVTVHNLDAKRYIVDKGVEAGDVLVAEGVGLLREGTKVKPVFQPAVADTTGVAVDTTSLVAVEIAEEEMAAEADTTIVL